MLRYFYVKIFIECITLLHFYDKLVVSLKMLIFFFEINFCKHENLFKFNDIVKIKLVVFKI